MRYKTLMSEDRFHKLTQKLLACGLDFAELGIEEGRVDTDELGAALRSRTREILQLENRRKEKQRERNRRHRAKKANETSHETSHAEEPSDQCGWKKEWDAGAEQRWQNSLSLNALDTSSTRAGWLETFGEQWETFAVTPDLLKAAEQAAEEWNTIVANIRSRLCVDEKSTSAPRAKNGHASGR